MLRALEDLGAPLHDLDASDVVKTEVVFQIGVEPNRIDVLTSIDGVEFEDAWSERITVPIDGLDVPVLSRRDPIQNKFALGRPQHLVDVAALEAEPRGRERPQ